jgi:hypothetical protein
VLSTFPGQVHDATVAAQCVALHADRDRVKGQSGFHWWPDRIEPN